MKKRNIFAVLVVLILLSSSVLYGCDITATPSASAIINRYEQMVNAHTNYTSGGEQIIAEDSLFNANKNFAITYADSNLKYEIMQRAGAVVNPETAIFSVFNSEYPITVYSSLLFFNHYRHNLLDNTNVWTKDSLKAINNSLLEFEKQVYNFKKTKQALENISISYNSENITSPYSYSIMVKYNDFKVTYQKLIYSAISLSKSFEKAFFETVSVSNQYLETSEVPYFEVRRSVYSATVYLAEAVYHYYFNHNDGFLDTNANKNLYNEMVALRSAIQTAQFSDATLTGTTNTSYYRTLRAHEKQVSSQSSLYVNAIMSEKKIKNSTKPSDISLYNDFVEIVNEVTQNYRNYASYATEMITRIGTVI